MAPAGAAARVVSAVAGRIVINLLQNADDLIDTFSSGAKVYLLSASTEGGSYSAVANTALVSGTEQYELEDLTATTSTWYKVRVGNSAGTTNSDLSDALQATAALAYATLDDLIETMPMSGSTSAHNLLADLLVDTSDELDTACARRFHRSPQVSGTATVYVDVVRPGLRSLALAAGVPYTTDGRALDIISVTTLKYRDSESTSTYSAIASGDTGYYLEAGYGQGIAGTDWPYEDITLSPSSATITTWPTGRRAVELVGVLGFPRIPTAVKRAVIERTRERYRQSPHGGVGEEAFGESLPPAWLSWWLRVTQLGSPYRKGTGIA